MGGLFCIIILVSLFCFLYNTQQFSLPGGGGDVKCPLTLASVKRYQLISKSKSRERALR